jgi:integrase
MAGSPVVLTTQEARDLAVRWYGWFTSEHEVEPGTPDQWDHMREQMADIWSAGAGGLLGHPDEDEADEQPVGVALRRRVRAKLTELSRLPSFLAAEAMNLSPESLNTLLDGPLPGEFEAALGRLARLAAGSYEPDLRNVAAMVPARSNIRPAGMTAWEAFEGWVATGPRASTVNRWRAMFLDLDARFGRKDVAHYTGEDARQWRDALLAEGKSRRVVRDVWLSAARTVFNWLREEKQAIAANPFDEARLKRVKVVRTREPFFTPEEVATILSAALAPAAPRINSYLRDAYRWVPWLCAYTGARSGEITQLRSEDVQHEASGAWAINISPEAGTVKGQVARRVPLHEHLIAQGFIEFAAKRKGPLFYDPSRHDESDDPTNPVRPPYVLVRQKLAAWVRKAGVTDRGISPNHAWRHTFKRKARRAGIEESLRDAICGHADGRAKAVYETPTMDELVDAIAKFPRYEIERP